MGRFTDVGRTIAQARFGIPENQARKPGGIHFERSPAGHAA
nr:MAG TPA: hypothetical protein [Caudoviricetes sp.]